MAVVLTVASLSALRCGWVANGVNRLDQLYPQPDAGISNGAGCLLPNMPDGGPPGVPANGCLGLLNGQWAARFVQLGIVSPPVIPPSNLITSDLFLVRLSEDRAALEMQFCGEENILTDPMTGAPVMLGVNTTPQALINGVGAVPVVIPLDGGSLPTTPVPVLWGWEPADGGNSSTDPLPDDAGDPRVYDEDGDNNPGVTIHVLDPVGNIYIVRRDLYTMGVGATAGGWITGPLLFDIKENILGADNPTLAASAPITPRNQCTSVYQMICVEPTYTCQDLVNNYQTLFINAPQ
jgi:hypothetical protein